MSMCGYCTTPQACAANGCAYLANRPPHDVDARALKARFEALTVERDALKGRLGDLHFLYDGAQIDIKNLKANLAGVDAQRHAALNEAAKAAAEAAAIIKAADAWCFAYLDCNLVAVRGCQFSAPDRAIALAYAIAQAARPGPGAALLERVKKLEAVAKAAKRLSDNIAEFETITDGCFIDSLDEALAALDAPAAHDGDGDAD